MSMDVNKFWGLQLFGHFKLKSAWVGFAVFVTNILPGSDVP